MSSAMTFLGFPRNSGQKTEVESSTLDEEEEEEEDDGRPKVGTFRRVVRRPGEDSLEAHVLEANKKTALFYVHYSCHDRRLDEWVRLDQFQEEQAPGSEETSEQAAALLEVVNSRSRRSHKRRGEHLHRQLRTDATDSTLAERMEAAREEITRVKNVSRIVFSGWEVETWYWSPFPEKYHGCEKLYICDFTLRYTASKRAMLRHSAEYRAAKLPRHPPGLKVYDDGETSLWEVDGKSHKLYCQSLCLISKLFLDHKTLYYDVDPFLFYVLTEPQDSGHHILGYFSKEKSSPEEYNLACILTFPQYQRRGFGTLLISLSYELTKSDRTQGAPEKPLSDLGKLSYRAYWSWTLLTVLREEMKKSPPADIDEIARRCGLKFEDAISTLSHLKLIRHWKGQYVVMVENETIEKLISLVKRPPRLCDPTKFIQRQQLLESSPPSEEEEKSSEEKGDQVANGDSDPALSAEEATPAHTASSRQSDS